MHDSARSSKSKDITFDAGSREIFYDPGVPSSTAAGSRDPDPTIEVEEPKAPAEDPHQIMPPPLSRPASHQAMERWQTRRESRVKMPGLLSTASSCVKEAQSLEHRLSHFPKNAACPTCQRSRMYCKRVVTKRADPLADRGGLSD